MAKQGDFSMIALWVGLEARRFLQASIEDVSNLSANNRHLMPDTNRMTQVERCVKYDLLSPNV